MWVKLTKPDGNEIYVNMDRFDKVEVYQDEDGNWCRSLISSCLSSADEDIVTIEVRGTPDKFMEDLLRHGK